MGKSNRDGEMVWSCILGICSQGINDFGWEIACKINFYITTIKRRSNNSLFFNISVFAVKRLNVC